VGGSPKESFWYNWDRVPFMMIIDILLLVQGLKEALILESRSMILKSCAVF